MDHATFVRSTLSRAYYEYTKLDRSVAHAKNVGSTAEVETDLCWEIGRFFCAHCETYKLPLGIVMYQNSVVQTGGPPIDVSDDHPFWALIEPLNGFLSPSTPSDGLALPLASAITLFDKMRGSATYEDITSSAIVDMRRGSLWSVHRTVRGYYRNTGPKGSSFSSPTGEADWRRGILFSDLSLDENRRRLGSAFRGEKTQIRSTGCALLEMAMVANGLAAGYVSSRQSHETLAFGYAAIKSVGGAAIDFDGRDIGTRPIDLNRHLPVVLARSQTTADQILERLHRQ